MGEWFKMMRSAERHRRAKRWGRAFKRVSLICTCEVQNKQRLDQRGFTAAR